jgi:hypothetical protein
MVGINCEDMTVRFAGREGGSASDEKPAKKAKGPHGTW